MGCTVGVLTDFLGGFYHRPLLAGIHALAQRSGVRLVLCQGLNSEIAERELAHGVVDGWIMLVNTADILGLMASGKPIVTVSVTAPPAGTWGVLSDNYGGVKAMIEHLLEHGHRRIAYLGNLTHGDVVERFAAYCDTLRAAGLPLDPALILDVGSYTEQAAEVGLRRLLAAGLPCDAIIACNDMQAQHIIGLLAAAGYSVPDDLAVLGFDDIDAAQRCRPPLTTVRQQFDRLGETALAVLLAALRGENPPALTHVPTALVVRRSCGCDTLRGLLRARPTQLPTAQQMELLSRRLVNVALDPLPLDDERAPTAVWPGVANLVGGVFAAVEGSMLPSAQQIEQAWREALALSIDVARLHSMVQLMEQAGRDYCAAVLGESAVEQRLTVFLDTVRLELLRTRVAYETELAVYTDRLLRDTYTVSQLLLGDELGTLEQLTWLRHLAVRWGMLWLWGASGPPHTLSHSGSFAVTPKAQLQPGMNLLSRAVPPAATLALDEPRDAADVIALFPVCSGGQNLGVLALCGPYDQWMRSDNEDLAIWGTLLAVALQRRALSITQATQQATLQAAYERERSLADMVRELGSPVIPLQADVLLVPLVGVLTAARTRQIVDSVLESVSAQRATAVLLDVTGVPVVDSEVATALVQLSLAVGLLGARVTLIGIRPEIAQSIVGLGLDLGRITTQPNLAAALQTLPQAPGRTLLRG